MKIHGGSFRGRNIFAPVNSQLRPTASKLRAAVFNIISSRFFDCLQGARVVDLFAGSGLYGFEALSQGAESADFIENFPPACRALAGNIKLLGLHTKAKVICANALSFSLNQTQHPYSLLFADPPYSEQWAFPAISRIAAKGGLAQECLCVVELGERGSAWPEGFFEVFTRNYGRS